VEEDCPEKHAYIPYLYARNCIAKIMEDMKAMKQNHLVIVENIQMHYGEIESETQVILFITLSVAQECNKAI
jgi:hypothetical protein